MTVDQMRAEIAQVYPTPKWKLHVDGMPDRQVIAIYMSMKRKGRFDKKKNRKKKLARYFANNLRYLDF